MNNSNAMVSCIGRILQSILDFYRYYLLEVITLITLDWLGWKDQTGSNSRAI